MSGSTFSIQLPQPNAPFFDANGGLSVVWLNWFLAIQNRTGGTPGIPAAGLQAQIISLFVEQAFNGDAAPQITPPFAMLSVVDDPPPAVPSGLMLLAMMGEDQTKQQPSPFMAALLTGDVS